VKEKIVNLTPGMAVTVEVKMGKRRLIEFLLSPLLKYKNEAVRER
jgi:hemolysin D